MAPGFCTLRALTTWNTSTMPSALQLSVRMAAAENTQDLPTVSLQLRGGGGRVRELVDRVGRCSGMHV